jgi:hypothetical protein
MWRLLFVFLLIIFSCSTENKKATYSGNLKDLIVGEFVLEKDSLTQYIHAKRVLSINGKSFLFSKVHTKIQFYDMETGKLAQEINFEQDGPNMVKGGPQVVLPLDLGNILVLNSLGNYSLFYQSEKLSDKSFILPKVRYLILNDNAQNATLVNDSTAWFVMLNKSAWSEEEPIPIDFKDWIVQFNFKSGESKNISFPLPKDYGGFLSDPMATELNLAYDSKRHIGYVSFPYSDSVIVIKESKEFSRIKLASIQKFNYKKFEKTVNGNSIMISPPKDGALQLAFLYDPFRDLILRIIKKGESGESEESLNRTKLYSLLVYDPNFELLGELKIDYEPNTGFLNNFFVSEKGLFVNKPNQSSDDYYVFWHIDLSNFHQME